ncbi:hypothetical protein GOODEAATRI_001763, partial [Goodea atripinnis]
MQDKIFCVLVLSALLTMTCIVVFLSCNKDSSLRFLSMTQHVVERNRVFFGKIMEHFWATHISNVSEKTNRTSDKLLELCPDTPPTLVGPLLVEFETKRNLEDVRQQLGPLLEQGGWYKPPNCIAKQK